MIDQDWNSKCFYRVSIKAVIHDQRGRVLVVKEQNNSKKWNLPGGGMDYGEDEYRALQRELLEEVGYHGGFKYQPLGIRPMYLEAFQAWQLWIVYKVQPDNYNFTVGTEAQAIAFIDPEEFKEISPNIYSFATMKPQLKRP